MTATNSGYVSARHVDQRIASALYERQLKVVSETIKELARIEDRLAIELNKLRFDHQDWCVGADASAHLARSIGALRVLEQSARAKASDSAKPSTPTTACEVAMGR